MDIADKKHILLKRAEENALKAELASDLKVKQTFLDLAQAYRNMARQVEEISSLRERARRTWRMPRKNT